MGGLNVAFLLGYPEISGGTNIIMEHAVGLSRRGHKVSIVTELPFDKQRLAWHPEAMQLECLSHEQIRDRVFDISIATWWRSVYDLPYVQANQFVYFCQSIESRFFQERDPDMKALAEFTYRLPIPVVTEATWIKDYLQTHYGSDVTLVHNGIRKDIFTPEGPVIDAARPLGVRLLVEGPLGVPFKKVEDTIRLCQLAGARDIWLLTSTPTAEYPGVTRLFSKVPMREVPAIYRSCDVIVKLSVVEGMFGPPLEMMHCGGTAITTDVTGYDEYMKHGENGLVVPIGNEQAAIQEIKRLIHDPDLLSRLKDGASLTAQSWPDWPTAVSRMEAFLVGVATRSEPTNLTLASQQVLKAALRLSGPLHASLHRTYSKRDLLHLLQEGVARAVKRDTPFIYRAVKRLAAKESVPARVEPLPRFNHVHIPKKQQYRIGFIGNRGQIYSLCPQRSARIEAQFIHVVGSVEERHSGINDAFNPDVTFVFVQSGFDLESILKLRGSIAVVLMDSISQQELSRYQFFLDRCRTENLPIALLHLNSAECVRLQTLGLPVVGAYPFCIDSCRANSDTSYDQWTKRSVDLLIMGESPFDDLIEKCDVGRGFLQVKDTSNEEILYNLLPSTKVVLYASMNQGDCLRIFNVARDLAYGCLVISQRFDPWDVLMAGEHYLSFSTPSDVGEFLTTFATFQDAFEQIRSVGQQKARTFNSDEPFITFLENMAD